MSKRIKQPFKQEHSRSNQIYLALQANDSIVSTFCMKSTFDLGIYLYKNGFNYKFHVENGDDYVLSLNKIANEVLLDPSFSHAVILNGATRFPIDIVTPALRDGISVYFINTPNTRVDLRSIYENQHLRHKPQTEANELLEVNQRSEATIFVFSRNALRAMVEGKLVQRFQDWEGYDAEDRFARPPAYLYGFFSPIYHSVTRNYLSNFDAFIYRWEKIQKDEVKIFESEAIESIALIELKARFSIKLSDINKKTVPTYHSQAKNLD